MVRTDEKTYRERKRLLHMAGFMEEIRSVVR